MTEGVSKDPDLSLPHAVSTHSNIFIDSPIPSVCCRLAKRSDTGASAKANDCWCRFRNSFRFSSKRRIVSDRAGLYSIVMNKVRSRETMIRGTHNENRSPHSCFPALFVGFVLTGFGLPSTWIWTKHLDHFLVKAGRSALMTVVGLV